MYEGNVEVNYYSKGYGSDPDKEQYFVRYIKDCLLRNLESVKAEKVDIYNLNGERHNHDVGSERRYLVFANASCATGDKEDYVVEEGITVNGEKLNFKNFLPPVEAKNTFVIKSDEGVPMAEWIENKYCLNILFDIFAEFTNDAKKVLVYIAKNFNKNMLEFEERKFTWGIEDTRESICNAFSERMKQIKNDILANDKSRLSGLERDIENYRQSLCTLHRNLTALRASVEAQQTATNAFGSKVAEDFDLILSNPKVKNLKIIEKTVVVETVPIIITASNGERYYGGEYRIELKPETSEVKFFGGTPRQSCWTDHDPHPHVDGYRHVACLGNAAEPIAELCSQLQIYPAIMICIDFLEQANLSDTAGRKVVHWDRVNEKGEVIEGEETNLIYCACCNEEFVREELYVVFDGIEDDGPYGEHLVCEDCRDERYEYIEDLDAHVAI